MGNLGVVDTRRQQRLDPRVLLVAELRLMAHLVAWTATAPAQPLLRLNLNRL
ncbi:MAG: hypothetical protein OXD50_08325 [Chloroflexi bacterium]|nr:hypothetical protein [Chloroflexota bacterium]